MSKKKRDKAREARKRRQAIKERRTVKHTRDETVSLPDRRVMEGKLAEMIRGGAEPRTPLERAQALVFQAYEGDDPEQRCQLAQQALAISSDCADAYVLLAEYANSRAEALDLYARGVQAATRALGEQAFREHAGHFWGVLETRPYMRAREGLARLLWVTGRRDEAVGHLHDLLRLNPNDNQGLRYQLACCYFFLDRGADLRQLLDQYPDEGSATWAYCRALLAFRDQGDTPESRRLLQAAKQSNKHVPAYLLELKLPPEHPPGMYSPGQESEAIYFIREFLGVWKSTPGALEWLRANSEKAQTQTVPGDRSATLAWREKQRLLAIPRRPVTWQADLRPMPHPVEDAGRRVRPSVVIVTDPHTGLVLAADLIEQEVSAASVWKVLVKCIGSTEFGPRRRPGKLQVRPGGLWESLRPILQEIGIRLVVTDKLAHLDEMCRKMFGSLGDEQCGLLDTPGVEPTQVGALYAAAASFYRSAPWKKITYESALEIACAQFPGGPCYAVIMGAAGMTFGLTLYDDLRLLRVMFSSRMSDHEGGRRTVATTVVYGTEAELPLPDMEAAQRHGWEVAGPDAYPWVFRKEAGADPHPPSAPQIELLEASLRAVPDFLARRRQTDTTREEIVVTTASGERRLAMRWVEE